MGMKTILKNIGYFIVITCQFFWSLTLVFWVLLPWLVILAIRRSNIKLKIQRKLRKYGGMPRKQARVHAKKYRKLLQQTSSVRGIMKLVRASKGLYKKDAQNTNESISLDSNNLTKQSKGYTVT
ncbi:MAG: hypothetical protein ACTSSH_09915 [Candidatus Heimdallarchaeota archaeon]